MSYTAAGTATDGTVTGWSATPQADYATEESVLDLEHAKAIAAEMAGLLGGDCTLNVSGHANPARTPEGGWAVDQMSVSVARLPAPAPAPQPATDAEPF